MDWGTEGWMDGVNWGADRQMDHWDCYSWRTEGRTDKQKVQYFFEIYAQKQYFSKWAEISPNLKCAPFEQNQGYKSWWLLLGSCSAWLTVSDSKRYFNWIQPFATDWCVYCSVDCCPLISIFSACRKWDCNSDRQASLCLISVEPASFCFVWNVLFGVCGAAWQCLLSKHNASHCRLTDFPDLLHPIQHSRPSHCEKL